MTNKILLAMAAAAAVSLSSCSSDDGPEMPSGETPVPADMTLLRISPQAAVQGRGNAVIAATANLKDFDFIITFTSPAGSSPMKGRYDVSSNKVYSTNTGGVGSADLFVPRNSVFTVTAVAAGQDDDNPYAVGGLIDYSPAASATKVLAQATGTESPRVPDCIYGVSASQTASSSTLTVPVTLDHQTSKLTFSAEVAADADYVVCMAPIVNMFNGCSSYSVDNATGAFSNVAAAANAFPFYLKPCKSANIGSVTKCKAFGNATMASQMVYLCNKDGKQPLMFGPGDAAFSLADYGARENARQIFWWPGSYSPATDSSDGAGLGVYYEIYHCVYVNGVAQLDGAPMVGATMKIPLDLTGSKALVAGKSYNFNIKFMDDPADATKVTVTPTVTPWEEPGMDATFSGNGWTGNVMPSVGA